MGVKRKKYKIVYQGLDYELTKTGIARLTNRSRTFIDQRLSEGYSMQEAVDLNPGDPRFLKKRRTDTRGSHWHTNKTREKRAEALREAHSDVFKQFLGGQPCFK